MRICLSVQEGYLQSFTKISVMAIVVFPVLWISPRLGPSASISGLVQ